MEMVCAVPLHLLSNREPGVCVCVCVVCVLCVCVVCVCVLCVCVCACVHVRGRVKNGLVMYHNT